jgi:hypothetical protein
MPVEGPRSSGRRGGHRRLNNRSGPVNASTVNHLQPAPERPRPQQRRTTGVELVADGDSSPAGPVMAGGRSGHHQRGIPGQEDTMVVAHAHQPGRLDPGHCRGCAREADLWDHSWQGQPEQQAGKETRADLAGARR